jgi:Holliday junction resolvasome RuvABC endonuclease subunit
MQVLGIRAAPKEVRYAILEGNQDEVRFVNADDENRLRFPLQLKNPEEKIHWLYQEFVRILKLHPKIERIAIKEPEFTNQARSSRSGREIAYYNGVILLLAAKCGKYVRITQYKSIGTKYSQVSEFATEKVGCTKSNWNRQMADAVAVAWSEIPS